MITGKFLLRKAKISSSSIMFRSLVADAEHAVAHAQVTKMFSNAGVWRQIFNILFAHGLETLNSAI